MKARLIALALASVVLSGCVTPVKPLRVSPQDLPVRKGDLLHAIIAVQGCLNDSRHGAYIRACNSTDPHSLTLVSDPNDKIPRLFMSELGHLGGELPVAVVGRLVTIDDPDARNAQQIYLEVQSINIAGRHEP